MDQQPFKTLDNEFGIAPTTLPELESTEIVDMAETVVATDGGIDNKDYVVNELKEIIMKGGSVLEKLDADIKIGSPPRAYEVYLKGMESMANVIGKLADIEATDRKLKNSKKRADESAGVTNVQNNFFNGTSTDMLKALKEIRKQVK